MSTVYLYPFPSAVRFNASHLDQVCVGMIASDDSMYQLGRVRVISHARMQKLLTYLMNLFPTFKLTFWGQFKIIRVI